jgi:putative cell wall-binding protein
VPASTAAALAMLAPARVTVVGGESVVSAQVADALGTTDRLAGPDRYATSAAVADASLALGLESTRTWLATGRDFPDALAVGVAAARAGDVVLLVDGTAPTDATMAWMADHDVTRIALAGGEAAITPSSVDTILPG